ncbi:MAG: hypothetical protein J0J04_08035 [Microbacterium sp.]|uniref:hypothetical protein n=1 Tax=Microbacterium sp. TaxID=51671 RepID=UPI001ACF6F7A|nr:hypothetical protein [Microbacterium sp.]MBN9214749.1 hypothetical protein [Microbacterium sp.]
MKTFAPEWDHRLNKTAPGEWELTVTNVGHLFSTYTPLGVGLKARLLGPLINFDKVELTALTTTHLNPGESAKFRLRIVADGAPFVGAARVEFKYLTIADFAYGGATFDLAPTPTR